MSYVADNGGRTVPLYFTVTSLWAALDGSLVLWLIIVAGAGLLLGRRRDTTAPAHQAWAMVAVGVVAVFFFALTYFAANPFAPVAVVPVDGPGPNPLLREHPAIGVHPPLLYAGYVGMVVPFGYGVAALILGTGDERWLAPARRWMLGSWVLLTLGIVLGAWWSYAVLGWGGYWAWDPVENASLLPWLTATAGLHVMMSRRRGPSVSRWSVTLCCTTFVLVLLGTFLTRSGAVASVHSFTESPLGPMLLGFVVLVVGVVAALLMRPAAGPAAADGGPRWWSRDSGFLAGATLLTVVAVMVLIGTIYPLVDDLLTGRRSSVEAGYYNTTAVPALLAVLLLMGLTQLIDPAEPDRRRWVRAVRLPAAAGLVTIVAAGILVPASVPALAALGLAVFLLTGVATTWLRPTLRRSRPGMLAHAGVAIATIGITASSAYPAADLAALHLGESVSAGGVTARLTDIERRPELDRMTVAARLVLERDGRPLGTTSPVMHYYPARDTTVGVPAILSRPWGDVYLTLTGVDGAGGLATVRLAVNWFVPLIWAGGALIALGGLLALLRRERREPPAAHPIDTDETASAAVGAGSGP